MASRIADVYQQFSFHYCIYEWEFIHLASAFGHGIDHADITDVECHHSVRNYNYQRVVSYVCIYIFSGLILCS